MNKKKIGFTLPEILMTLVLAGFIAIVSVQAINANRTAYTSLAYYAFNNLKSAVGELIIPESQGESESEKYTHVVKGPYNFEERLLVSDSKIFCEGMDEIMNTQGSRNCSNLYNFAAKSINDNSFLINGEEKVANFITTNGQKYYIGTHIEGDPFLNKIPPKNGTYGYRVIAIDINGEAKPNSSSEKGALPPDIISFAILDSGEILPLGAAADNYELNGKTYNYLTSKINAFNFKNPDSSANNTPAFCSKTGTCDYDKLYLKNPNNNKVGFSFRQAYCGARISEDNVLKDYCPVGSIHSACPPLDSTYDVCKQEVIKPMFRFNFN